MKCALWTLKEGYSKALGLGLRLDFSKIEFPFPSIGNPDKEVTLWHEECTSWATVLFGAENYSHQL